MIEVVQRFLVASTTGGVIRRRHARVPFAVKVGFVPCLAHVLCNACHVSWYAGVPRHLILGVKKSCLPVSGVDVDWIPPGLEG